VPKDIILIVNAAERPEDCFAAAAKPHQPMDEARWLFDLAGAGVSFLRSTCRGAGHHTPGSAELDEVGPVGNAFAVSRWHDVSSPCTSGHPS
jgi:hypothetical protein